MNPTTLILCAVSITDFFAVSEYMLYAINYYILNTVPRPPESQKFSSQLPASLVVCHKFVSIYYNCTSVWLHVLLALWRYKIIRSDILTLVKAASCSSIDDYFLLIPQSTAVFQSMDLYDESKDLDHRNSGCGHHHLDSNSLALPSIFSTNQFTSGRLLCEHE